MSSVRVASQWSYFEVSSLVPHFPYVSILFEGAREVRSDPPENLGSGDSSFGGTNLSLVGLDIFPHPRPSCSKLV